ncbi:Tetratricopeptide-like helical [Penicillium griseofulvum]|uniref:Tetratricopeptide-like helical n=1 Tax=Penicillium patulum TaxID=5078 RepID=A0A135LY75_PENPA|nr:Tetratricopeptide-like helical [Penicillium griseofulvum]KXG53929.1 Tetratricopeptide-like helical [Penicillium griseofulvum]
MADTQDVQSPISEQEKRTKLDDLIARAAAKDATKDHDSASELYSQATELQAELNGELSPENADLLYAYGKSLYNVAVSKSDVLGSKVAGEQPQSGTASSTNTSSAESKFTSESVVQDTIANSMEKSSSTKRADKKLELTESKPFFQFTGDENFVDSEDEDDETAEQAEDDEEDDDFANAFEVLDLARVLYLKKLSAVEENDGGKGKSTVVSSDIKHIRERIADTHDLQAEISLEAERFSEAVTDLRTVLELRNLLYPLEDPSVAECHYKLSLALEFASVQQGDEENGEKPKVDEEMRKEAATQMEHAIASCKVRMAQEQKRLEAEQDENEDKATAAKRKIANVKEIITEMEQRLVDLRRPPVSIEQNDQSDEAMLKGVLGQIIGQSATDQKAQLEAASKGATDLSAFVKRKPAKQPTQQAETASKRPAEEPAENGSKRSRVDDTSS